MSDGLTEQKVTAENDRERQARQVQQKQQVSNNQADWDRYVDSRIELYLNTHRAGDDSTLPDALHEALGQILAEERRQWRRERELIQSEARAVVSDLRATIAELAGEIRQKVLEAKPGVQGERGEKGPPGPPGKLPIATTFQPGRVYYEGEVVVRDGSTYQALRDTGHGVTHPDWICRQAGTVAMGRRRLCEARMMFTSPILNSTSWLATARLLLRAAIIPAFALVMVGR